MAFLTNSEFEIVLLMLSMQKVHNWTETHWDCGHQWYNQLEDQVSDDSTAQCYLLYHAVVLAIRGKYLILICSMHGDYCFTIL